MSENSPLIVKSAQDRFIERQKKAADRMQATSEYESQAKARAVKTARLREMRLAKEGADRAAEPSKPVKTKTKRVPRSVKGKTLFSRILTAKE